MLSAVQLLFRCIINTAFYQFMAYFGHSVGLFCYFWCSRIKNDQILMQAKNRTHLTCFHHFFVWGLLLFVLHVFMVQPVLTTCFDDSDGNTAIAELMDEEDVDETADEDETDENMRIYARRHHFMIEGDQNNLTCALLENGYAQLEEEAPFLPPEHA